jgi:phage terminase small subunit
MGKELTEMRERFCQEFVIDLNATQAAIRAGYSEKTASSQGQRLLTFVEVQDRLKEIKQERSERTQITQDKVLVEIAIIALSNAADYAHVVEKECVDTVNGVLVTVRDENGEPVKYRTVEPVLTEELTEEQQRALAVIKKGRDGFEVKTHNKLDALRLLGVHLGMWNKKGELDEREQQARIDKLIAETARIKGEDTGENQQNDGFMEALKGEVENVWDEE